MKSNTVSIEVIAMILCLLLSAPLYAQTPVKGRVLFEGVAPPPETVDVKSDTPTCGNTKSVPKISLGQDNGVVDALVTVVGASVTVAEGARGRLDQINCEFLPHVQALPVGATLVITSSDPVLHNAHGFYEDGSTAFNIAVPIAGMEVLQKLSKPGIIKLRCDAGHTWMSAYVAVKETPFYAVTDPNGNFMIPGVPTGNYEIEVWHEWLGRHRQTLAVKEGEETEAPFSLKNP